MSERQKRICIICGAPGRPLYRGLEDQRFDTPGKFDLSRCPRCGLIWLAPMPLPGELQSRYRDYYSSGADPVPTDQDAATRFGFADRLKKLLRQAVFCGRYGYRQGHGRHLFCGMLSVLSFVPVLRSRLIYDLGGLFPRFSCCPDDLIVDVGCGRGEYLEILHRLGCRVLGVELAEQACRLARARGLEVVQGTLHQAGLADASVRQISLIHVLEHVPDFLDLLQECCRVLQPGGRLVIHTPNAKSLCHRIFRECTYHLDPPRHVYLFSPDSLSLFFRALPFSRVGVRTRSIRAASTYASSCAISRRIRPGRKIFPWLVGLVHALEALLCFLGYACGEEIEVVAIK